MYLTRTQYQQMSYEVILISNCVYTKADIRLVDFTPTSLIDFKLYSYIISSLTSGIYTKTITIFLNYTINRIFTQAIN